jgi:hypothetical protein
MVDLAHGCESAFDVAQSEQVPSFVLGVNRGRMKAVRVEDRFTPRRLKILQGTHHG